MRLFSAIFKPSAGDIPRTMGLMGQKLVSHKFYGIPEMTINEAKTALLIVSLSRKRSFLHRRSGQTTEKVWLTVSMHANHENKHKTDITSYQKSYARSA